MESNMAAILDDVTGPNSTTTHNIYLILSKLFHRFTAKYLSECRQHLPLLQTRKRWIPSCVYMLLLRLRFRHNPLNPTIRVLFLFRINLQWNIFCLLDVRQQNPTRYHTPVDDKLHENSLCPIRGCKLISKLHCAKPPQCLCLVKIHWQALLRSKN